MRRIHLSHHHEEKENMQHIHLSHHHEEEACSTYTSPTIMKRGDMQHRHLSHHQEEREACCAECSSSFSPVSLLDLTFVGAQFLTFCSL